MFVKRAVEPLGFLGWSWVAFIVIYTLARDLLAGATLSDAGLPFALLFVVDMGTALPYGYYSAFTAKHVPLMRRTSGDERRNVVKSFVWHLVLTFIFWVAPWLVVALTVAFGNVSWPVRIGVGTFLAIAITALVRGVLKEQKPQP